jgi:hypothetical protein
MSLNKTKRNKEMENTIIKQKGSKKSNGINRIKISTDKKISNENFRDKLNEMLQKTAADKLKAVERIAENTVKLGFEKAVAHFENPAKYPLPQGEKNLESAVYDLLKVLPKKKRNKLIDKVNELLKAPADKRKQTYGDIVNVDFSSNESIVEQVKKKYENNKFSFNENETENLKTTLKSLNANINLPVPQQAASAGTLGFFVDSMTCLNPDDVLKDEVSLGGFIIDSLGNTTELAPRFIGKFRKDETVSLGVNNKLFTVTIDPLLQQQTFTANLFIIESDLVANEDALFKVILVLAIIGSTLAVIGAALAVALIAGAAVPLTIFFSTLITSFVLSFSSTYIVPLLGDDISNFAADILTFDERIEIGAEFSRIIQIGDGFNYLSSFDGKYTAAARWVGEP